jgi:trigger factor
MEETGQLTARIKIRMEEADFQPKVESKIKELKRSASMPGFRAGKVPEGMIRRMYEKSVLVEEVDKLLSETLSNYLRDNKLSILGYPLANETEAPDVNWDEKAFEFWFDIGLSPEIDKDLKAVEGLILYSVKAVDTEVEETIDRLRQDHGEEVEVDKAEEKDIVYGTIIELDETGGIKEDGISHDTTLLPEKVKDEDIRAQLTGLKVADTIVLNPGKAAGGNIYELGSMIVIPAKEAADIQSDFRFTVSKIARRAKAEMKEEFFLKLFPGEESMDEETFRNKVREAIENQLQDQAKRFLLTQALDKLVTSERVPLPEEFLKQWLMRSPKNEMSEEEMEKEFPALLRSMRYQVLQDSLMELYDVNVSENEIRLHIQSLVRQQFGMGTGEAEAELEPMFASIIDSLLQKKEDRERYKDQVVDRKFNELLMENLAYETLEIPSTDFEKMIIENNNKDE